MLKVEKLSKYYNKKILDNITFCFKENHIYCISGKSGSGKSTFLSIISGINKNYLGNIYYDNVNIKNIDHFTLKYIGYVYQSYQLFEDLTVLENIEVSLKLLSKDIKNFQRKILFFLKYFNIENLKNTLVKNLSGGQKQRVALIRALINDNKILLLDEPTSALDESNKEKLFSYLNEIKKDKIIILVTHDESLANKCDEILDISNTIKQNESILDHKKLENSKNKIKISFSLKKKVFSYKKIFKSITSYVLSFSLICICMCNIISSFINDVISNSFKDFNNDNKVCIISKSSANDIDFSKKQHSKYEQIYYEGIERTLKEKLKESIKFDYVKYNDSYIIDNHNFIFDNYLSSFKENFVLLIPKAANLFSKENNYIDISYKNKKVSIKIDKIFLSEDLNFYLYCNNISYLNNIFKDEYDIKVEKYIYSPYAEKLCEYFINDNLYNNYLFFLDKINNVILIKNSNYPRINKNQIDDILNKNNIDKIIYSDYTNSYIDFDNGLIYIISNNEAIQVILDESISFNSINISSKYYELTKNDKSIKVSNRYLIINEIISNNQPIIYISSKTFNDLNDKNTVFGCLLYTDDSLKLDDDTLITNSKFIGINDFVVFKYIVYFIMIYGIIITILAYIGINIIFNINFSSKKKDLICLYNLGVDKFTIIKYQLIEPIKILFSSYFSFIISYILIKILICVIYYQISNVLLEISFSISFMLLVLFFSFISIVLPLFIKLSRFFNKIY